MEAQLFFTVNTGVPSQCYNGANQATFGVTSIPSGATSFSWSLANTPTCSASWTPAVPGGSIMVMSMPCVALFSVTCAAYNSSMSQVATQVMAYHIYPTPVIAINSPTATGCIGTSYTMSASGGVSYTWVPGSITAQTVVLTPLASICYTVAGNNSQGCTGYAVQCVSVQTGSISVTPTQTVCKGSSANFTASGATSYTWNTVPQVYTSTVNVLPLVTSGYTVTGIGTNGCLGGNVALVVVDTTCADVWPGDANSDGVVDNTDVFELGLAFNATGAPRSSATNAYTSQHATTWSGLVSSGKNKCHADCNGDGTINNNDTVAIYNNYNMTHSFRPASTTVDPEISLSVPPGYYVFPHNWGKADIMLGNSSASISQLYGVAFEIDFDTTYVQSAYVVYTSSFLNATGQNVQFRKTDFTNGKIYAASVRTSGSNVSGNGKIGEFWFKAKGFAQPNQPLVKIYVSDGQKISNTGSGTTLSTGGSSLNIVVMIEGIGENQLNSTTGFYPNPTQQQLTLHSSLNIPVNYAVTDITGRELMKGEFENEKILDVSQLESGAYLVRFGSGSEKNFKKLIIER